MRQNSGPSFICHGFNTYCKSPKFIGGQRVMYRTAVVIKNHDFDEEWALYDDLFWRMLSVIAAEIADSYCIKMIDQTAPTFDSVSELRAWQSLQKESDSEFFLGGPGEIDFFSAGFLICHMVFEDWSDVVKPETYAISFTFSFYSYDKNVNAKIGNVLQKFLSSEESITEIAEFFESPHPKWYWCLLNIIKKDAFFYYVGFAVFVLYALVLILKQGILAPMAK